MDLALYNLQWLMYHKSNLRNIHTKKDTGVTKEYTKGNRAHVREVEKKTS